jgi:hypothetical protein
MRVTVAVVLAGLVVLLGPAPAYADGGSGGETVNVVIPSTTAPPPGTSTGSGSGGLAFTGAYLLGPAVGAAVLIALGVGLTVTTRRRRHQ